jgi:ATP synthase protein I
LPTEDPKPKDKEEAYRKYLRYSQAGLQFFAAVTLFTLAGHWLDRQLGTTPLFILLGLALGFGGGFYSLYRELFVEKAPKTPSRRERERVDKAGGRSPAAEGSREGVGRFREKTAKEEIVEDKDGKND